MLDGAYQSRHGSLGKHAIIYIAIIIIGWGELFCGLTPHISDWSAVAAAALDYPPDYNDTIKSDSLIGSILQDQHSCSLLLSLLSEATVNLVDNI